MNEEYENVKIRKVFFTEQHFFFFCCKIDKKSERLGSAGGG